MTFRNKKNMQIASMIAGALACLTYLGYYLLQYETPISLSAVMVLVIFGILHVISKYCENSADKLRGDISEERRPTNDEDFE